MIQISASGNLVKKPDVRYTANGKAWATFRIACDTGKDNKGEKKPAMFFSCVCFYEVAENLAESLDKGDGVVVVGNLELDSWTGDDNVKRETNKIIATHVGASLRYNKVTVASKQKKEVAEAVDFNDDDLPF